MKSNVFISYSHQDKVWLEKLQKMLKPLLRNNPVSIWDDTQIRAGARWKEEIENALSSATVAVLLVSADFLASEFIGDNEVPRLLESARTRGLRILWVLLSDCMWKETEIANYQAVQMPPVPLDGLGESGAKTALRTVCDEIKRALTPEPPPVPDPTPFENVTHNREPISPPPLPPRVAQFAGTWQSMDGSWSVVRQEGDVLYAEMYVNLYGFPTKVAWGQGRVVGNRAAFDFLDMYGVGGRSEFTLSPDGRTISGGARYNNGMVTSIYSTRT